MWRDSQTLPIDRVEGVKTPAVVGHSIVHDITNSPTAKNNQRLLVSAVAAYSNVIVEPANLQIELWSDS